MLERLPKSSPGSPTWTANRSRGQAVCRADVRALSSTWFAERMELCRRRMSWTARRGRRSRRR